MTSEAKGLLCLGRTCITSPAATKFFSLPLNSSPCHCLRSLSLNTDRSLKGSGYLSQEVRNKRSLKLGIGESRALRIECGAARYMYYEKKKKHHTTATTSRYVKHTHTRTHTHMRTHTTQYTTFHIYRTDSLYYF